MTTLLLQHQRQDGGGNEALLRPVGELSFRTHSKGLVDRAGERRKAGGEPGEMLLRRHKKYMGNCTKSECSIDLDDEQDASDHADTARIRCVDLLSRIAGVVRDDCEAAVDVGHEPSNSGLAEHHEGHRGPDS